ncbi:hypothetical protein C8R43DRAFT_963922 [Mycena crocata]|nr:hypothetical protein C8R43DRAFT_963922 [Mycena crocata]
MKSGLVVLAALLPVVFWSWVLGVSSEGDRGKASGAEEGWGGAVRERRRKQSEAVSIILHVGCPVSNMQRTRLDLLRNRNEHAPLGAFDGKVAAFATVGGENFFITTNADYVPAVPSLERPHALFLRSDMRYGTDDPALWPQQWSQFYCHLPVIASKGSRPEIEVMWWDPSPNDFVVGSAVTRGLGKLHFRQLSRLLPPINTLVEQCKKLQSKSTASISPLFGQYINTLTMWVEQLEALPTTYTKMVFAVTSLQRVYLELDALYNYTTVYKPRIENYINAPSDSPVAKCVGAFTLEPAVAQQLFTARLPFWFLRPTYVFDEENIMAVVELQEPSFSVLNEPGEHAPPILYTGNSTREKIAAIQHAAAHTPWYRDPFETGASSSLPSLPLVPSGSAGSSSHHNNANSTHRFNPYSVPSSTKKKTGRNPKSGPSKLQRDKFSLLSIPEMPPHIASWSDALAGVDRSVIPFTSNAGDRRYVLPEPALLVNSTPERRRMFLHHWSLLSDGFLFLLSQPPHAQLLTAQEWRDILEGLLTKRGHAQSKTYKRSVELERFIRPALEASGIESVEGFPVPPASLRDFSLQETREIVWVVAETSFRFEFCALDKRASKKERVAHVQRCFAGRTLIGTPLHMSKRGLAATEQEERHRYLVRMADLMLDWTTRSARPEPIRQGVTQRQNWSQSDMERLEHAVCCHYAQAFWEHFGRPPVVPMRLDHDLGEEPRNRTYG